MPQEVRRIESDGKADLQRPLLAIAECTGRLIPVRKQGEAIEQVFAFLRYLFHRREPAYALHREASFCYYGIPHVLEDRQFPEYVYDLKGAG